MMSSTTSVQGLQPGPVLMPAVTAVTIHDLPNEVLQHIFHYFSGRDTWIDRFDHTEWKFSEIQDENIKNIRLTCRWFKENATHLVDQIRVNLSAGSILRFETMCSNSRFQQGVQAVEVCIAQYDSHMADSFDRFAKYHIEQLQGYAPEGSEMMAKAQGILRAWRKFMNVEDPSGFSSQEGEFIDILVDGHRQYGRNFREQQALVARGVFAPRVAAALAELQNATHLDMTDWETTRWGDRFSNRLRRLDMSTNRALFLSLSQWRMPVDEVRGPDVVHVVPDILSQLFRAGKSIRSVNIQLSPALRQASYLGFSVPLPWELRLGLRNLRSFRFEIHPSSRWWPPMGAPAATALRDFFDHCCSSQALECIAIDSGHWCSGTPSLFNARRWPALKYAELKRLGMTEADLDVLTSTWLLPRPDNILPVLVLHWVRLIAGSWDRTFNTLNARHMIHSLGTPPGRRSQLHARLRLGQRDLGRERWSP